VVTAIFADISIAQLALITGAALIASVIGGVSGYGTGALMPLVLVPILGPAPVVPIIALSSIFSNAGRTAAFRALIDRRRVLIVLAGAIPTCVLGAWGYTMLSGRGAALVIGGMLASSVPLRRLLRRRGFALSDRALAAASIGYGVVVGGTTGSGIILLSLLMAAGLQGANVIATDALISIIISFVKLMVFGFAGVMDAQAVAVALLIGGIALPGSYLAKLMVERMPLRPYWRRSGARRHARAAEVDTAPTAARRKPQLRPARRQPAASPKGRSGLAGLHRREQGQRVPHNVRRSERPARRHGAARASPPRSHRSRRRRAGLPRAPSSTWGRPPARPRPP
jgi:uncharacterized protein